MYIYLIPDTYSVIKIVPAIFLSFVFSENEKENNSHSA